SGWRRAGFGGSRRGVAARDTDRPICQVLRLYEVDPGPVVPCSVEIRMAIRGGRQLLREQYRDGADCQHRTHVEQYRACIHATALTHRQLITNLLVGRELVVMAVRVRDLHEVAQ